MKKRMLSLLLTACMLLGLLPGAAAAAEITDATITMDTDLSSYTSPASWVTLTVPASTTVTLSGNVTLNKVHLVIGAGATVTLSGVKLLGKEYAGGEFTSNAPTVSGGATSTLILTGDAAVTGSQGLMNGSYEVDLAPAPAVSGVGKMILSGSAITGGNLIFQGSSYSQGTAAGAIVDAAEVYAYNSEIACGQVTSQGQPQGNTAKAIVSTGNLTYYTDKAATVEVTGTATRLYRLQATGATVSTAPAKDITAGEQTLKLYAAATQITATNSFSGGDWIVKDGSGTLVDTPALSGDSPTFAMPAHDLSIEGIAAVGAVEVTGGEIKALDSTALDDVLGSGNYTTESESGVTVIKLTQNLAVGGGIAFNGVTAIFDLNGHAIKGKPGVSYAGGIGIGGSGSDPATVVTLRATGGGSVTGKSSSGYGAVNLSAKNGDDKLTIEGGVYTGVDCAALAAGSPGAVVSLEITGGTFLGAAEEDGLYFAYGGVDGVITGGTFSSAYLKTEAEYGEKWAISGGTFVDELTCGKYSGNAVSGLLAPGYTFQIDGVDATTDQLAGHTLTGRVTVVSATPPVPTTDVSWTLTGGAGGSGTLEEAFAAFSAAGTNRGGAITVNRDFTAAAPGGYNGFYLNNDRYTKETPIALNLNGKNVDLGSTGIHVRTGTLTVSGSGSLTTTGTALVVGYLSGVNSKLILSGGDVTGDPAVEVQSGTTFDMSGGSLTCAGSVALSVGVSGNAVITGGSVTAAASTSGIISLSTNAALTLGTNDGTVSTESPLLTASGDAYITTNIILGLDGSKVNYYDGKLVAGKDMMKPIYDGISSSVLTLPENYILHTRRDAAYATTILETAGSNANLKELTLEEWNPGKVPVPLSPAFASGTTAYTAATALAGQRNLTFLLTADDDYIKKMEYKLGDGAFEQIGKFSNTDYYKVDPGYRDVKDGQNVFIFRVTAENGATKDYTVTVTVTADPNVAQVTTSGGVTTKYEHFSDALEAVQASAGSTLKLLKNVITDGSSIYITGSFTLDLGGKTLLCHMIVKGSGALTIDDSATGGSLVGNGSSIGSESKYALSVWENGSLNIKGGTVIGGAKQGQYSRTPAISSMGDDVSITISGGTVRSYDGIGISASGSLTVSSGTVSADDTAISASGVLKISGGTISTTAGAAAISIRDSGVLHLSNAPVITGGELANLTLMSAATCHIMASDGGTPYSGEKLTIFLSSENQKDGAVLVGGLTNADHAKKFEPKYINKGLTVQYNDANKNMVLVDSATPPAHVPVTDITGVPTAATAGEDITLTGTVAPANATNKAIVWSVKTAGATGATITGSTLKTTAAGTVTVTATIANGQTASTPFTKDFTITVTAKPVLHVHDGMTFEPYPKPLNDGVTNVYLKDDLIANLDITEGVILNLCLNGHSLTASHDLTGTIVVEGTLNIYDCNGSNGSHLITVNGTEHTITGGLVIGGSPVMGGGGGVNITAGGAMTLHGGTIAGNTVNNSAGGGVYVLGTFTMEGGAISYNTVTDGNGGGLCVGATANLVDGSTTAVGTAILNGGTISHNAASGNGGGVRVVGAKLGDRYATLILSGTTIANNTAGAENGIHSGGQVILDADCGSQSITWQGVPITLNAPLTAGTRIALDANGAGADTVLVTGVTTQAQADLFMISNLVPGVERFYEANAIKTRSIPTGDISGSVTDDGETPSSVNGVDVKLMKGGTGGSQVGSTVTTDGTGSFKFEGVPYGSYSLVASKDGKTITRALAVIAQSTSAVIVMPGGNKNTKVEVTHGTPSAAADKLEEMFTQADTEAAKTGNVEIKLVVDKKTANDVAGDAAKITSALNEHQEVGAYLDAKLLKTITGTASDVTDERIQPPTGKTVRIVIDLPVELQNRAGYVVVRVHNDVAATLAAEYDKALQTLTFEADAFSTYAVAYTVEQELPTPPADTGSSVTTYAITATAGEGGSISPKGTLRVTRNADKSFTITPDEGYEVADVLVDGMSVGKVSTYTFEKVTAKHTIEATFRRTVKNPFTDVTEDDWFYDAVTDLYEKGLMNGTAADSFSPLMNTDRATIVTILWRMEGMPSAGESGAFPDVPAVAWYAKAVAWAAEKEIVKGYDTGKFGPADPITREQLVTILWRYAGSPAVLDYEGTGRFTDTETISPWAAKAVTWALSEGILTGKGDGILDPTGKAARAEAAAMVERFMKKC